MKTINVKNLLDLELSLHRPNKEIIGILSNIKINSITKNIDDIDSINFEINYSTMDRFSRQIINDKFYSEVKEERLLCLNNSEYYVITSVDESFDDTRKKIVNAVSLEHKLTRIKVFIEDAGLVLVNEDVLNEEIAIMDLLHSETGWNIGHIDEGVRYDIKNSDEKSVKVRWQDSVNDTWYSFLIGTIADIFGCIVEFDTYNKTINLYDIETYGENLGLYLSKDNYIKSIERKTSSDNIVTRLSLVGKDEIDIRDVNPTGKDYVEDYSYFIKNGDMSIKLQEALNKHDCIVNENHSKWEGLASRKVEANSKLVSKKSDFLKICEEIKVLIATQEIYEDQNDTINAEYIQEQIDEKTYQKDKLETEIRNLELTILEITEEINLINRQLDRENAIDDNGNLIFTKELLDELNEFLYYDTYSNNAYIESKDLMDGGKKQLDKLSKPTVEYTIDSINLLKRMINKDNDSFKGDLSLGDVIILYDDEYDEETFLYFVGYEYSHADGQLNISLSNKKSKINNSKSIADFLKQAKNTRTFIENKAYMLNKIKYNKI